ncbi:aminotransferase class IV [Psychrobacter sp. BF1]|uniref:aminotransferase class IV n=1 Tax=Psychrobacter sp. BF1 TaxID=2821147 RepID=UPI00211A2CE1|nr:aminotransferase class IV [Psychrobacter sp. BF1]
MLTPNNRGLAYGDGFFTTMAVIEGTILWLDYHQQRLISHSQALQLDIDSDELLLDLQAQAQQLQQGMLKLIITRAEQALRGYGFRTSESGSACEIWLKATPITEVIAEQLSLPDGRSLLLQPMTQACCLASQLACLPPTLAGLKSLNRLDNVLASGELQSINAELESAYKSYGEGLLRDMSGAWVEGTMSNVFYQLNDTVYSKSTLSLKANTVNNSEPLNYLTKSQWYTPSMSQSGVAGVMRQVLIDSLAVTTKPVIIRPLTDNDLPQLSQLFFCNAVRGVMPVSALTLLSGEVVSF